MSDFGDADKAFWLKCGECSHCWPAAYWPMEARKFCSVLATAKRCPKCAAGSKSIFVAKQEDGILLEPPCPGATTQTLTPSKDAK